MSGTSVGTISLDLVIKEQLTSQLDDIKKRISGSLNKPVDEAVKSAESSVQRSFDSMKKAVNDFQKSASGNFDKVTKQASQAFDTKKICEPIESAVEKTREIFENTFGNLEISSDPVQRMEKDIELTCERLSILQKKWQELQATLENAPTDDVASKAISGLNTVERQMLSLQSSIEKTSQKIAQASGMDKLTQTVQACNGKIKAIEEQSATKIEQLNERISASKERHEQQILALKEQNSAKIKAIEEQSAEKVKRLQEKNEALLAKLSAKRAETIKKKLGGAFNTLKSIGGKAVDRLKSKFGGLKSAVSGVGKPLSKLGTSIARALKTTFLMAGVYAAFRGIKSVLSEACESNDDFAKSLNEVKANLNIAFTPILNAIMPAINTLMSGLATATKQLAAFTSELFGSTYKKSLETVKQIKSVSKEAEKSSTYLAGYDEMNVVQDNSSDSSSDSSDSSDSGVDYSAISGDGVELPDWAERMKDAIRSGDWSGVGSLLAESINGIFDSVDWDGIQSKVNGFAKSVADTLNGFVSKLNWSKLGQTFSKGLNTVFGGIYTFNTSFDWDGLGTGISEGLNGAIDTADWSLIGRTLASNWNAVIDTLYAFVTGFDFSGFGQSIGEAVNGWFDEIDWVKLGTTLSEAVKGVLDTAIAFLQSVDWQKIGEDLWSFVASIDWSGIASRLFETIGSAIGSAVSLLWGFIKDAVFSIRDYFAEKIQECGGNVAKGLFTGIIDALKNLGTWIYDNIFKPFIDGFKKCFGIHSPSTVMAEMGDYIIEGLCNAVSDGIEKVKEIFSKVLEAIQKIFNGIGKWFGEIFKDAWEKIKSAFSAVKSWFSDRLKDIKNVFASVSGWFGSVFSKAWSAVTKCFKSVGSFFSAVWKKIKEPFSEIGKWFSEKFESAWNGVKSVTETVWNKIVDVVKAPINLIIGAVNGMLQAIEDGINWVIDGINELSFDVPDWVPGFGGETFGFDLDNIDIPEIPALANGGLATAPTLAMVGDNRNASTDPEVIAPLSKLQGLLENNGELSKIVELLSEIAQLIRELDLNVSAEIDGDVLFKVIRELNGLYKRKTGVSAFA